MKDETIVSKAKIYLEKARYNLETLEIFNKLNMKSNRNKIKISLGYDPSEWIVISGYYAMYSAALALISRVGFRSKSHLATISIIEKFYVDNKVLSRNDFSLIKNAVIRKEELESVSNAKNKREIAQYSITKKTTKEVAEKVRKDAYDFVNRCEEVLNRD